MSRSADDLPPLARRIPVVPGSGGDPLHPAVPIPVVVESRWTKVARFFAIVRDIVLIAAVAVLIVVSGKVLTRVDGGAEDGVSGVTAPECVSPSADQWGTFCPETPGGGGG